MGVPATRVAAATLTPTPPVPPTPPAQTETGTVDETRLATDDERLNRRRAATDIVSPLAPGDEFGPRYRILRILGAGGMGIVYHAWDEVLGVAVALKVIRTEISADPATARELEKRFKRELLLARQVTHHNVVRIHDIGEVEGTKYITMSFLDGRDLATVLKASGHLPVSQVLALVRQLAEGLQAAHDAGVIHRDLKPANIMVEGDALVIMDFGIARSALRPIEGNAAGGGIPSSRSALVTSATMQGAVIGTVAYMAPEQAKGLPADHRSDLYAVGMIMRDMLIGLRATQDPDAALTELTARMARAPKPIQEIDASIPDDVDRIVTRCLQPDPAGRYQSVLDLLADLNSLDAEGRPLPKVRPLTKRLVAAAALLVLTLLGGTFWLARTPAPPVQPPNMSVLIADFDNQARDPVFEGALEKALAIAIEGASFITAYSRVDAQTVADRLKPGSRLDESMARLVSRREGIHVILAGTIAPDGSGYRVTVRAVDPALDPSQSEPLATASAEAPTKAKVLEAVGSLASEVREALGDTTPEGAKLAAAETFSAASLEAMSAYARGQGFHDAGRYGEAIEAFQQATSSDPNFGRAYASMGAAYGNLKRFAEADESYKKALTLIDRMTDREKYRTFGGYYLLVSRNYYKAIENYEQLVRLYPADEGGHLNLAFAYLLVRNFSGAVAEGRKATEIAPKSVLARTNYAMYAMYAGDFNTSMSEANVALKENPSFEFALLTLARSSVAAGDFDGGRKAYDRLAALSEFGASLARLGRADLEMYLGGNKEAAVLLETGLAAGGRTLDPADAASQHVVLAEAYLALGRRAQAIRTATKAVELSRHESVLFPAALVLIDAGRPDRARQIAETLDGLLQTQTSSFARLIDGEIARTGKRLGEAVESFRDGQKRYDSWFAHFLLGRAYLEAKYFPEAVSEFELCVKRKGEATDVFFLDASTIRYLPPAYYWLGRAQEGVGAADAARKSFETFVALRPDADRSDRLAADARERVR